ncbi:hypothetical protein DV454_001491 [Geotrichum candidum]|nr:hypothetical protein DV454_001491 [Geotrichum candidum]
MWPFSKSKDKSSQYFYQQEKYAPPTFPPEQAGPSSEFPKCLPSTLSTSCLYSSEIQMLQGGILTDYTHPPPFPVQQFTVSYPDFSANTEKISNNNDGPPPGLLPSYERRQNSAYDPFFSYPPDAEGGWGDYFTSLYPLYPPRLIRLDEKLMLQHNNLQLVMPPSMQFAYNTTDRFKGFARSYNFRCLSVHSDKNSPDTTFVSSLPLFSPYMRIEGGPHGSGELYFEVTALRDSRTAFIAIGFTCLPYPRFRFPGRHRGSVAVYNDGRLNVNDPRGSKPFVMPFMKNQTVGLGINLNRMIVFFTRNGQLENEWSLKSDHKEVMNYGGRGVDPEHQYCVSAIEGFDGAHDIYPAVGISGEAALKVNFGETHSFLYRRQ